MQAERGACKDDFIRKTLENDAGEGRDAVRADQKYHISPAQITRLKRNESVSTHTIETFCRILHCRVEDVMEYIED